MEILEKLRSSLRRVTLRLFGKRYSLIDEFPLYNWDECLKGDFRWVHKNGIETNKQFERFESLQDQYIARFDLHQTMIKYLEIKMALIELRKMYIETGDRMLLNQIEIEVANRDVADPSKIEGMTIDQCLAWLRTQMPSWINKKIITIVEFRELMDEYGRRNKEK